MKVSNGSLITSVYLISSFLIVIFITEISDIMRNFRKLLMLERMCLMNYFCYFILLGVKLRASWSWTNTIPLSYNTASSFFFFFVSPRCLGWSWTQDPPACLLKKDVLPHPAKSSISWNSAPLKESLPLHIFFFPYVVLDCIGYFS